jgi:nitroimidazol reductase NimA-like FMN-containing flavoprotein (pyridoxamine 5'-phosphate oxidase superfamily)
MAMSAPTASGGYRLIQINVVGLAEADPRAPGRDIAPMTQHVLEVLSEAQCLDLIRKGGVGRFVFQDDDGPGAIPVNYGVAGDQIVFRLEPGSHLREVLKSPTAFEVDHFEAETGLGWSVLIRGPAQEIAMESVPAALRAMGKAFPQPWAEGVHNVWVSIAARKVTGRRLTAPSVAALF